MVWRDIGYSLLQCFLHGRTVGGFKTAFIEVSRDNGAFFIVGPVSYIVSVIHSYHSSYSNCLKAGLFLILSKCVCVSAAFRTFALSSSSAFFK